MSAAAGLVVASTVLGYASEMEAGRASEELGQKAAERGHTQRVINEIAAGQLEAIGQRKALEAKRQAELMASRALAVAAAGGAAGDIDNLIADIKGEGVYRANIAMYEAETQAEQLRYEGLMAEQVGLEKMRAGEIAAEAGQTRALSTVLSGAASLASLYKPSAKK